VRVATQGEISWELEEAGELRAMIVSAIKMRNHGPAGFNTDPSDLPEP